MLVFAESEAGKQELMKYTPLGEHKIRVVPIFGGGLIELNVSNETIAKVLNKWNLKKAEYFLYPAQYWAHKNHVGLLNGFAQYLYEYPNTKLILCGSDKGNKSYILETIKNLGIEANVVVCGFVSDEELSALYRNAKALVMASYFGPTNMPPIEAMDFGIPVVCSDIDGHKEILGEAGIYFDAMNYESIKNALVEVSRHREKYVDLIAEQNKKSKFKINHALTCIDQYLKEACIIRSTWGRFF